MEASGVEIAAGSTHEPEKVTCKEETLALDEASFSTTDSGSILHTPQRDSRASTTPGSGDVTSEQCELAASFDLSDIVPDAPSCSSSSGKVREERSSSPEPLDAQEEWVSSLGLPEEKHDTAARHSIVSPGRKGKKSAASSVVSEECAAERHFLEDSPPRCSDVPLERWMPPHPRPIEELARVCSSGPRTPPTSSWDRGPHHSCKPHQNVLRNCMGDLEQSEATEQHLHTLQPSVSSRQDLRNDPMTATTKYRQERLLQDADVDTLRTYKIRLDEDPVGGAPRRHGTLMILDVNRKSLEPYTVMLFDNGFYAVRDKLVQSFALSPFSVLLPEHDSEPGSSLVGYTKFSLSVINAVGFVFAHDDEEMCRGWIDVMAQTLRAYTKSFFPKSTLTVEPREGRPSTSRRIVAGYLLWLRSDGTVSVPFCELQAHYGGAGALALYENDRCEKLLTLQGITSSTLLNPFQGVDCSVVQVNRLILCARTSEERYLWWRAISNVQVKCFNGAPDPTPEDLRCFRLCILECIRELELDEASVRIGARAGSGCSNLRTSCQEEGPAPQPKATPTPLRSCPQQPRSSIQCVAPQSLSGRSLVSNVSLSASVPEPATPRVHPRQSAPMPPPASSFAPAPATAPPSAASTVDGREPLAREVEDSPEFEGPPSDLEEPASEFEEPPSEFEDPPARNSQWCRRPPPSRPGPGLHEPPCAEALQRATDVAIVWMSQGGQLNI